MNLECFPYFTFCNLRFSVLLLKTIYIKPAQVCPRWNLNMLINRRFHSSNYLLVYAQAIMIVVHMRVQPRRNTYQLSFVTHCPCVCLCVSQTDEGRLPGNKISKQIFAFVIARHRSVSCWNNVFILLFSFSRSVEVILFYLPTCTGHQPK